MYNPDLTFAEYQDLTFLTVEYPSEIALGYLALGLGEAGEIQNKVKKVYRDFNGSVSLEMKMALIEELGDLLWYISMFATELGVELSTIAQRNIEKLTDRKSRGVIKGSGDSR